MKKTDGTDEWSDDDALWEAMEPALCAQGRMALAEGDVAAILAALELPEGASILDLGCGPGAHALAFAARGCTVSGVDRTHRLLNRAKAGGDARGLRVEWIEADMREFRRPGAFDLICSLYTSFGYFDDRGNRRVLENILASLKAGSAALLDLSGRESTARHWRERASVEIAGVLYQERRSVTDDWSILLADWSVVRNGVRQDFHVRQRLYTGTEFRQLLVAVGFTDIGLFGSLDTKTPYDQTAERLVAVARAPRSAR